VYLTSGGKDYTASEPRQAPVQSGLYRLVVFGLIDPELTEIVETARKRAAENVGNMLDRHHRRAVFRNCIATSLMASVPPVEAPRAHRNPGFKRRLATPSHFSAASAGSVRTFALAAQ